MNIYSPYYFKDDFTENKNRLKNQGYQHENNSNFTSDVKKEEKQKKEKIKIENKNTFSEIINHRINILKEHFYKIAGNYFKEDVV